MALTVAELEAVVSVDERQFDAGTNSVLSKLGKFAGGMGKILGAGGVAAGGLFAAGVHSAMNLEDTRARMQAELGLTAKEAERFGKVAGDVYAGKFGSSMEEVSAAISTVVSSIKGMRTASDAEVQAMTEKALTFADVFQVDVARAAQVAGQAVTQGLASDAGQAFDLLTTSMQKVPVAVREDILDAVDEYGGYFNALGIGGEQAFGMLTKSASKGMYGIDKTGDALKEFTIRATDMSTASKVAYDSIGMSQKDMARDLLSGGKDASKAFDQIIAGVDGIKDPVEKSQAALALFGTPLEDLGTTGISKFVHGLRVGSKGLGDFEGATDRMSSAMGNTASAKLGSFFRTIKQETVGVLGGTVLPYVQKFAGDMTKTLTPMVKDAGPVIRQVTQDVISFAEKMSAKAGPIIEQVKGVLIDLFREGGKGREVFGQIAEQVSTTWLTVMDTVGPVIEAIRAFFNSELGGALVDGLVRTFGVLMTIVNGLLTVIKGLAQFITGVFTGDWGKAWEGIKTILSGAVAVLGGILAGLWNMLRTGFTAAFGVVRKVVSSGFNAVVGLASQGVGAVVGFVRSLPGKAAGALSSLGGKIGGVFRAAMNGALGVVRGIGGTIYSAIAGIPGKLLSLAGRFGSAGRQLLQGFVNGMKNAAGIISGIAGNVWNAVRGMLNGAIDRINGALSFTIDLPGPKNLPVNIADIPHLATGAYATGATLAVIGEGREPESVLPDSVLRGLLTKAHDAGASTRETENGRRALMGDVNFYPREGASARELIGELMHGLRVADFGGVYA
jgi:phage-related minor tail protein